MQRNGFRTSDGVDLLIGAIPALSYLRRVGSTLVGVATTIASVLRETGGPTDLTIGAIADGQFGKRVGATFVGGTPGDVTGPASATDNAVTRFDGTTGKLVQNSLVTVDDSGNIAVPANATVDGYDLSNSRLELSHSHGSTKSMLPSVAAAVTTSGTAYFVYLGQVTTGLTATLLWMCVNAGGTGAQTAEMGLFSTPLGAGGNQSLTKIVATASLGALTGTGNLGVSSSFAQSIAPGTHLWAGVRTALATTQPSVIGLAGDHQQGAILTTAASGALTGAGPFAGVVPGFSGTLSWLAPDLRLQFT